MPRRYYDYLAEYTIYHQISTVGSWIIITGMIIMFTNLIKGVRKGKLWQKKIFGEGRPGVDYRNSSYSWEFDELPLITAPPYEYNKMKLKITGGDK